MFKHWRMYLQSQSCGVSRSVVVWCLIFHVASNCGIVLGGRVGVHITYNILHMWNR